MTGGLYCSPYHLFRGAGIDTVRYGNMEMYKEDIEKDYPDLYLIRRVDEITTEYDKKVAYLSYISYNERKENNITEVYQED
jgi:hypothetical protein